MGMAKSLPLSGLPMATPPCGWRALAVMVESVSAFAFAPPPPPPPPPSSRLWTARNRGKRFPEDGPSRLEIRYDTTGPGLLPSPLHSTTCNGGQLSGCWPCNASVRPPEVHHIRGVLPRRQPPLLCRFHWPHARCLSSVVIWIRQGCRTSQHSPDRRGTTYAARHRRLSRRSRARRGCVCASAGRALANASAGPGGGYAARPLLRRAEHEICHCSTINSYCIIYYKRR